MCQKRNSMRIEINGRTIRVDKCMTHLIERLNIEKIKTLSCCCGHGKYNMSIVVQLGNLIYDLISHIEIPRKSRFYKMDRHGFYYIPEVVSP